MVLRKQRSRCSAKPNNKIKIEWAWIDAIQALFLFIIPANNTKFLAGYTLIDKIVPIFQSKNTPFLVTFVSSLKDFRA